MTLFSEIYNCYFQILKNIIKEENGISQEFLQSEVRVEGFLESPLYILPKLASGEWNLLKRDGALYYSRLSKDFYVPLTNLQRSYLKTLLRDSRIRLFLDDTQIAEIDACLGSVPLLWEQDSFYYYDQFCTSDDYSSPEYRKHFRTLLHAMEQKHLVDIEYLSKTGRRLHHHYFPGRLEYSIKNDKFRLLAVKPPCKHGFRLETLNLDRMTNVQITEDPAPENIDINAIIKKSYYKEPVRLLIHNERNALERTMLHFANYEKNTTKLADDLYECLIYYNETMETELLIEVISFGPMVKVLGNERFLAQLKARPQKQFQTSNIMQT